MLNEEGKFVNTPEVIGVEPFTIEKKASTTASEFSFDAKTTKSNLHRLLRAF